MKMNITTLAQLQDALQKAIELEHSTIPPYLSALYTIKPGTNVDAYKVIRSVVVEEMLHMTLACNLLNAVGGTPNINHAHFVPEYPAELGFEGSGIHVDLRRFSPAAIDTFLEIEKPDENPEPGVIRSIGDFYQAIQDGFAYLDDRGELEFGRPELQISPELYYGGGGVIEVKSLDDAMEAMKVIVEEGEGLTLQIVADGDLETFGEEPEVAHYFRFLEIKAGQFFQAGDTPDSGPTGDTFQVDWDAVYPMKTNIRQRDYPANSEAGRRSHAFNVAYLAFLDQLQEAFNGQTQLLVPAVAQMFTLKNLAMDLIKNPFPGDEPLHAGPSFELPNMPHYAFNPDLTTP